MKSYIICRGRPLRIVIVTTVMALLMIGAGAAALTVNDSGATSTLQTPDPPATPSKSGQLALQHLREVMDRYHSNFDVYTDLSAAGNHFVMLGMMGGDVSINLSSTENPSNSSRTSIENRFYGTGTSWGGWYFMNGVLEGEETQPKVNWGDYPNAGFDLTKAKSLTFWAKGKNGGEKVEFFAFGVGRDAGTGNPLAPYPDSSPKKSLDVTLNKEWQKYVIDLNNVNLSYVLGGFGWVANAPQNNNQPVVFYLDDIRYDKARLDEPRFLVSYDLLPTDNPVLINTAFTYDNALALMAFLSNGTEDDVKHARLIADALSYAIEHDRSFTDGRLRNAYQGGDLKLFPGWKPNGKADTVRMPGWWDSKNNTWYEDKSSVGTSTGNVAWAMLALLSFYEKTHEDRYLNATITLGEWIEGNSRDARGAGGYTGGYDGWEKTSTNPQGQTKLLWKSTEHNIDTYVAFSRLYSATGNETWKERALHAKSFVEAMWNETNGHFWTGTLDDGVTINQQTIPSDVNAWGFLALGDKYKRGINWVENNSYVEADGFKGFDFNNDRDGIWFEGTAHMVVAYQVLGDETKANLYLNELRRAQTNAENADGKGLVAASHDGVSTGFDWVYNARPHVGATAWLIFAESRYNPFWNDILEYYRSLGGNPKVVETTDLLKAADDWSSNTAPPGFASPITTQQLLALADEWSKGG